jgi:hypothetical protein
MVTDVIQEMEKEFQQQAPPPSISAPTPAPVPFVATIAPPAPKKAPSFWDERAFRRAALVAVIAFIVFYPEDLSPLYEKVPVLQRFAAYEKILRGLVVLAACYVAFWKVPI